MPASFPCLQRRLFSAAAFPGSSVRAGSSTARSSSGRAGTGRELRASAARVLATTRSVWSEELKSGKQLAFTARVIVSANVAKERP